MTTNGTTTAMSDMSSNVTAADSNATTTTATTAAMSTSLTLSSTTTLPNTSSSTTTFTMTMSSPPTAAMMTTPTTVTAAMTTTSIALQTTTTMANTWLGLSMSNTILIAVFTGCTALILVVLCAICCRLLCVKSKRESNQGASMKRQTTQSHSGNLYADPYRIVENHYHSNDVTKLYATPEMTYAKPEIYSTFINPSFYEDVYARWKLQEQTRHEKAYDSPWQYSRRLKDQMETPDFKWSTHSLRALDTYDYDKYGRIPRGRVSSESEKDDTEAVSMEPPGFTTF